MMGSNHCQMSLQIAGRLGPLAAESERSESDMSLTLEQCLSDEGFEPTCGLAVESARSHSASLVLVQGLEWSAASLAWTVGLVVALSEACP